MAIFRITDVRARLQGGSMRMNLSGMAVSQPLPPNYPLARGAAILQVFNAGRECYFETNGSIFMTNPVPIANPPGSAGAGRIVAWNIRMPPNEADPIDFFFGLGNPNEPRRTSGVSSPAFVRFQCAQNELKGVLAMLGSSYVMYENGVLRNTDFTDGLA
jgi:hypothetical protein